MTLKQYGGSMLHLRVTLKQYGGSMLNLRVYMGWVYTNNPVKPVQNTKKK